ncbi:uncharacterized protein LOC124435063 [Xenia sp. Carnegie-2017]|uniref:uncharacterized protein LOC124435063 n=1 Tax=Xenia sp. Carnegie-2017 TaxID=2897299 RepID=UPI001F03A6EA|nr:uncharacterized protein LOC124435063 [Xenia sp. Carnegie-2017]
MRFVFNSNPMQSRNRRSTDSDTSMPVHAGIGRRPHCVNHAILPNSLLPQFYLGYLLYLSKLYKIKSYFQSRAFLTVSIITHQPDALINTAVYVPPFVNGLCALIVHRDDVERIRLYQKT